MENYPFYGIIAHKLSADNLMKLPEKTHGVRGHIVLAVLFLAIYYLVNLPILSPWESYRPFAQKFSMSAFLIVIIFLIGKIIEKIIESRTETEGVRYNLLRITRLITIIFVLIVGISFLFQNLYTAAVSFGIISLILGFALQAPITSFIAWLYIVFRRPYHVGDRIQVDGHIGDVIEISYLDTKIEECNGAYLGNDRKSGRIILFPNSLILKTQITNYSGPFNPFIWNETALQVGFTSDLAFVEQCLLDAALEDFTKRYPDLDLTDHMPAVYFRNNDFAWMEAVVSYTVEPEDTTGRRNRILQSALPKLNANPDKVKFPEGSLR